jgi:hypothetical protein
MKNLLQFQMISALVQRVHARGPRLSDSRRPLLIEPRPCLKRFPVAFGLVFVLSLTIGVGMTMAGFQVKKQIGGLSLDGWQLKARDGQLGLAKTNSCKWLASAPTITDTNGLFISGDPDGKTPTVHLIKDKGPHVNWAFEFSERLQPEKAGPREGKSNAHLLVGKSGFRFKMKLAEGPFKNWYVGVDALPPEAKSDPTKVPDWRPLKLVSDPKSAAVFDYYEAEYEVGHK